MAATDLLVIVISYGIGCISPGYWLVRWRTGTDIRQHATGRTGARNVGRALGSRGFAIVFLLDLLKGAVAVLLARLVGLETWGLVAAALAVIVGHIWPVTLRFRGGRGLATGFGAALALDLVPALGGLVAAALIFAAGRRFNPAGMGGVVAAPLAALALGRPAWVVIGIAAVSGLILFAHRGMIRAMIEGMGSSHEGDTGPAGAPAPPKGRQR